MMMAAGCGAYVTSYGGVNNHDCMKKDEEMLKEEVFTKFYCS
jgi:hypothetical protein